jgi:hypothetical protein
MTTLKYIMKRHNRTKLVHRSHGSLTVALALAAALGCGKDDGATRRAPPPAPKPATCKVKPKVNEARNVALLPKTSGVFCLDPNGSDKAWGADAKQPLDGICDIFDGECEIYKRHGVTRVVEARYVDGAGSTATIDVHLSKFEGTTDAYAMFTMRVVGDSDPAHPDTAKPTEGGGVAALGIGNAYLWRGNHLAEITYNDEQASAAVIDKRAKALLPDFVKQLGALLEGKLELPPSAAALPKEKLLPLGVRFRTKELLGVKGTGTGAFGYYADGTKRWRVLSIVRPNADEVGDILGSLSKIAGAAREKGLGDAAWRVMVQRPGAPQTEWLLARKGKRLLGLGDEDRVLREGMSPEEHGKIALSLDEKRALLKKLLGP